MKKKLDELQKRLVRVIISAVAFLAVVLVVKLVDGVPNRLSLILYLAVYALIGWDIVWKAIKNIAHGKMLDENFLMCVATIGAFIIGEYMEGVAVMLFYQTGELFQSYAVGKSRKNVTQLMSLAPEEAVVLRDGVETTVMPEEVEIGETIVVKSGEKVAIDGVVLRGESDVNTAALTGESVPRHVTEGDEVLSGSINVGAVLTIKTTREFSDSTVSRILDMVENASMKKAKTENFITKFARYYTPAVCGIALLLAIIPSIITGNVSEWVFKALSLLVISCPCALVISVPMGFFGGIGSASKRGILVKGGGTLEALAEVDEFVFDKTGTITKGEFAVSKVFPEENKEKVLAVAAVAERGSNHPVARAVVRAASNGEAGSTEDYSVSEIAGRGVKAEKEGEVILCGNARLMKENGIENIPEYDGAGSIVYVAENGAFLGYIVVADEIKEGSAEAIAAMKHGGAKTYMLTGDSKKNAEIVARESGVNGFIAGLLPDEKVSSLEKLIEENKGKGKVAFVGDGINDAPVIMRADVGIAMGGVGSDSAIEAADLVLMNDDLRSINVARKISKKTVRVVWENVAFALTVKFAVLILALVGVPMLMWWAVFADVGVSVLAILNSMRCLRLADKKKK